MGIQFGAQTELGTMRATIMKRPQEAFGDQYIIDQVWESQGFRSKPEFNTAAKQHADFAKLLKKLGVTVHYQPEDSATGISSIMVRDAAIISKKGFVPSKSPLPFRLAEATDANEFLFQMGGTNLGELAEWDDTEVYLEGGDTLWLDKDTLLVGINNGRTNIKAIERLKEKLHFIKEIIPVVLNPIEDEDDESTLPSSKGMLRPNLTSCLSIINQKIAVIYKPRFSMDFLTLLADKYNFKLLEIPKEEYENSYGAEVLVINPYNCIIAKGNPKTKEIIEKATKFQVHEIDLSHINCGGPVAITRPYSRDD